MAWSAISPDKRTYRGAILCAAGLMRARRQWDGVPEMWVTPCAPARPRKSPSASPALDNTSEPPPGSAGRRHRPIGHESIHRRGRDDVRQMLRRQIGRAKNQPSGDAIELDERQGRRQLIAGGDQDGTASQLLEPTPEARAPDQLAQRDARSGAPQRTVGQVAGGARRAPERAGVSERHSRTTE